MSRHFLLSVLCVGTVFLAGCGAVSVDNPATPPTATGDPGVPADGQTWEATVTHVVDGDTLEIRYSNGTTDTVRLVGVDTPETHGETNPTEFEDIPESESGRACLRAAGDDASRALGEWVGGAPVTLVHDPETDERGRYGRLLAYVVHDGSNVNYRLVASGHARVYDTAFTRSDQFYAAESAAQQNARGVWQCTDPASSS